MIAGDVHAWFNDNLYQTTDAGYMAAQPECQCQWALCMSINSVGRRQRPFIVDVVLLRRAEV